MRKRPVPGSAVVLATALALLLVAACSHQGVSASGGQPPAEVSASYPEDAAAQWDSAFNAGDVTRLLALYAEDVISMPFSAPTVRGRPALKAELEKFFRQGTGRHQTFVEEVLVKDDWAIERARYTLAFTPSGADAEVVETGRHVMCRRRIDGRWLIVWEIWNTDAPLA